MFRPTDGDRAAHMEQMMQRFVILAESIEGYVKSIDKRLDRIEKDKSVPEEKEDDCIPQAFEKPAGGCVGDKIDVGNWTCRESVVGMNLCTLEGAFLMPEGNYRRSMRALREGRWETRKFLFICNEADLRMVKENSDGFEYMIIDPSLSREEMGHEIQKAATFLAGGGYMVLPTNHKKSHEWVVKRVSFYMDDIVELDMFRGVSDEAVLAETNIETSDDLEIIEEDDYSDLDSFIEDSVSVDVSYGCADVDSSSFYSSDNSVAQSLKRPRRSTIRMDDIFRVSRRARNKL